jgi:hypothetical protein
MSATRAWLSFLSAGNYAGSQLSLSFSMVLDVTSETVVAHNEVARSHLGPGIFRATRTHP